MSHSFPYTIVGDYGTLYDVRNDSGSEQRLPNLAAQRPIVGDNVAVLQSAIIAIAPRRNVLARATAHGEQLIAANLHAVFIVTSPEPREFSLRRVERYLIGVRAARIDPIIILNKSDLLDDISKLIDELRSIADGTPVLPVSALHAHNIEAIRAFLQPHQTVALCGSSGVGKSTLINRLLGIDAQSTQEMRADGRGRHTTTARRLLMMPSGAAIVDTPGMRLFSPRASSSDIDEAFGDIAEAAATCRFTDCTHSAEPACAVREAVDPGRIDQWQKLRREIEWQATLEDPLLALERKARWKRIHKAMRDRS